MSKVDYDPRTSTTLLALPEPAHFSLVQVAYFMRLMAQLTEPGTNASNYEAQLRPSALAWCFSSLSKELDAILAATHFSDKLASPARRDKAGSRRSKLRH